MTISLIEGAVCAPQGFSAASTYAGIRKTKKPETALIVSDVPAVAAGTFTTNLVRAWCVEHNIARLSGQTARAIICNAGNANCCNGEQGRQSDLQMAALVQAMLGTKDTVLSASTGPIGHAYPIEKLQAALPALKDSLQRSTQAGTDAAAAIMTTDLVSKHVAVEYQVDGRPVRIGGIAKGSGMIAPNMATMLGFITTDVQIDAGELHAVLRRVVAKSFNCVTVDSDTSTNDSVLILANGKSDVPATPEFEEALLLVAQTLAKKIAADGEGATKLVTIRLLNAPGDARRIAKTIAESPLVKTACFGNDPNWGRIMAAAGRAGVPFDPRKVIVRLADHEVFRGGEPTAFDAAVVSTAMKSKELDIELEFLDGARTEPVYVWTCDFSYDYVKINADYGT